MKKTALYLTLALTLSACSAPSQQSESGASSATATTAADTAATTPPPAAAEQEKPMSYYQNKVAEMKTGNGTIVLRFFPDVAPNHVRNFIDLAEKGFYNGTKFHRVIEGFMIQGGDPNTRSGDPSTWGVGGAETNVKAEFNSKPHKRGVLSMARSQHPDSASSQFFIVVKDSTFLDRQYSVFGEVVSGMDVADKIVAAAKGKENPDDPVTITKVTIRSAS